MLENFEFFMIKPIHYDEVIEHLKDNFFYDEPLNQSVGLCYEKGDGHPGNINLYETYFEF